MAERHARITGPSDGQHPSTQTGHTSKLKFWLIVKTALARLRFIAVLAAVGAVIVSWDLMKAYYEKWTRPFSVQAVASSDVEFWCPMHPTVVRDKPDKCPICAMPLSKRKKGEQGEEEPLPPGVVSRVQLSPYRVALAGVQTWPVGYQKLSKAIRTVGFVEYDERRLARISARVTGKSRIDRLFVNVTGQVVKEGEPLALLYSPELIVTVQNLLDARRSNNDYLERMARDRLKLWGINKDQIDNILKTGEAITHITIRAPISGHVLRRYRQEGDYVEEGERLYDLVDLSKVWIEAQIYEDEMAFLREGLQVTAMTKALPNRTFHGQLAFIHPHLDTATRTLRVRFDMDNPSHELRPGMYATISLEVPATDLEMFHTKLREDWRDRLVAEGIVRAVQPQLLASTFGVRTLIESAVDAVQLKQSLVLAVPEGAVIDTGSRKIVYRESLPGVYDGAIVELGPRSGAFYPVVRGLLPGDEVATAGAFLIDAETRLTAGAASTYFGASGGPQESKSSAAVRPSMTEDEDAKANAVLAKLGPGDRALAKSQKYCPILKNSRLGSMGVPVKLVLNGEPVFLCCRGCVREAREQPSKTLDIVRKLHGAKNKEGHHHD